MPGFTWINKDLLNQLQVFRRRPVSFNQCKTHMKKIFSAALALCMLAGVVKAQAPASYPAGELYQRISRLNVLGSVLYIAAHPDDENTRLLAYMANERKYRTGYLSLTRGDGGQNLIGNEQGIDLGLIRTQELLAARRVDGAEQFFTSAYDFGYCKSPEEALATWNHDKILGEVVWVIRKFRPDIIIARFPTTGEGGHGHHTASAILAGEAFEAAADPSRYPEQLKAGVTVWKAKRLLWNTFNFGGNNTQREDQFKMNVGQYNPLLGKSYGELAAISRSQHKSQGFGVPSQRGNVIEYFKTIKGDAPVNDLMDGVQAGWERENLSVLKPDLQNLISGFDMMHPENSVPALLAFREKLMAYPQSYWCRLKRQETEELIMACSGLYAEAVTDRQLIPIGDSIAVTVNVINRLGASFSKIRVSIAGMNWQSDSLQLNQNLTTSLTWLVPGNTKPSQPYWIEKGMHDGSFEIDDPALCGLAQTETLEAVFTLSAGKKEWSFTRPVRYKYTDPVKGERYEPVQLVQPVLINSTPSLVIFRNEDKNLVKPVRFSMQTKIPVKGTMKIEAYADGHDYPVQVFDSGMSRMETRPVLFNLSSDMLKSNSRMFFGPRVSAPELPAKQYHALRKIGYDHIPDIFYHFADQVTVLKFDLKTKGKHIGYIPGAGDRVPDALEQMGYEVEMLKEQDIDMPALKRFDAIVTGVRAYNIHEWLTARYDALMEYVNQGGVLLVQYNTNNSIGPVKAKISPYPFSISRSRITDEKAGVNFLLPAHPVLHVPNEITKDDFEGWVQERSIYHAENVDSRYQKILSMHDPGEKDHDGSLIVADYGKGRFIYTGLVFFRQLPAGVSGAYRLLANLLAPPVSQ